MPRSTTLANSTAFGLGGPGSKSLDASGSSSADVISALSYGLSLIGSPTSSLTPVSTFVFPIVTNADPSACGSTLVLRSIFL